MSSIVIELQRDSLNPSVAVSDLLRKALFIATKLDIPEFKTWIENELSGYRDCGDSSIPPYRIGQGTVMGMDEWGRWIPVLFESAEWSRRVAEVKFSDSVAAIEAIVHRMIQDTESSLKMDYSPEEAEILRRCTHNGLVMHTRFIRSVDLKGVLDAVRTEILRWSLKLEKDGIVGEGMTFSTEEQRKASAIHYTTHFHAAVGNVAQHAEHVSQKASVGIQPEDLTKLVTQFSAHLSELDLDARQKGRAEAQLAILNTELTGDPDPRIVSQAVHTLRNITEGAIGSALATAATQPSLWHWVQQKLASF